MKARHVMIRASAGSGKTHALTNRFIELMAGGAAPDRIVALTFTRKAAGEFFDEILRKLARGAGDPATAASLADDLGLPQLRSEDFLRMLRAVVDAMPRLRLGTLDSFFGKIARTFPLELGLAGEFEILQEHAAQVERRRVLQRMFAQAASGARSAGDGEANQAQREFIEAFRRATFGTEEKGISSRLDAFLDEHHERYLVAPDAAVWGNPGRIWPAGCVWLASAPVDFAPAIAALRERLPGLGLAPGQLERWEAFLGALPEWSPGASLPDPVEYLLHNTLAAWPDVQRGAADVTVERRKVALGPEECRPLAAIVAGLIAGEL
ncbi:MAG: DNA helicase UvrD, partial [Verrucomicrobia bacterium]|nr:DNA helicase UvrD [Verrucomicrobiota bacterium]